MNREERFLKFSSNFYLVSYIIDLTAERPIESF